MTRGGFESFEFGFNTMEEFREGFVYKSDLSMWYYQLVDIENMLYVFLDYKMLGEKKRTVEIVYNWVEVNIS